MPNPATEASLTTEPPLSIPGEHPLFQPRLASGSSRFPDLVSLWSRECCSWVPIPAFTLYLHIDHPDKSRIRYTRREIGRVITHLLPTTGYSCGLFLIRCEWVIERHIERKGFEATISEDIRTLIRLSTATLGERPGRCSPYALAEALLSLEQADSSIEALTPHDLANGLATLPAERLLPELPEAMQKAFKTLVNADSAIGRSEILDRAGISEASYERNIAELAAVGLVESVGNGGHKKWRGWILPWWSPLAGKPTDSPRTSETDDDESGFSPAARVNDVLYQMALDLGLVPSMICSQH